MIVFTFTSLCVDIANEFITISYTKSKLLNKNNFFLYAALRTKRRRSTYILAGGSFDTSKWVYLNLPGLFINRLPPIFIRKYKEKTKAHNSFGFYPLFSIKRAFEASV